MKKYLLNLKISKKIILIFGLLAAVISVPSALFLTGTFGNAKSAAYKRAKKIINNSKAMKTNR